ncbi:hypothetical protein ACN2XU_22780 [Primorskyibacter sp. 2E107]|uniref:hypothetical protein n=1 Tax=Primorskyibacter sp. 2E107 TaxID=3403458 RepID=UPI003AF69E70
MRPIANLIAAEFCETAHNIHPQELFDAVLEHFFYMMACRAHGADDLWQQIEKPSTLPHDRFKPNGVSHDKFRHLVLRIIEALKTNFDDVLGDIAACIDVLYNTPDVCVMAKQVIQLQYPSDAIAAAIEDKGFFVFGCDVEGTGGIPMDLAGAFVENGIDYHHHLFVQTNQVDIRLFRMSYVQLHAREVPAYVALVDEKDGTERAGFNTSAYFDQFQPYQAKLEKARRNTAKRSRNRALSGHI